MIKECRESEGDRAMEKLQDEKLAFYIPIESGKRGFGSCHQ